MALINSYLHGNLSKPKKFFSRLSFFVFVTNQRMTNKKIPKIKEQINETLENNFLKFITLG